MDVTDLAPDKELKKRIIHWTNQGELQELTRRHSDDAAIERMRLSLIDGNDDDDTDRESQIIKEVFNVRARVLIRRASRIQALNRQV